MNTTSLLSNMLSLVPRRDAEVRQPPEQADGPRFELPELPPSVRTSSRPELSPEDDHERDHEREEAPEPRAELFTQRAPDELEPAEPGAAWEDEAQSLDTNGRARSGKAQLEAEMAEARGARRHLEASAAQDPEPVTSRSTSGASSPAPANPSQPTHAGQGQSQAQASHGGQVSHSQGAAQVSNGPGQPQNPQAQSGVAETPVQAQFQTAQAAQGQQVASLSQVAPQVMAPVAAQLAARGGDAALDLKALDNLDTNAPGTSDAAGPTGLDALLEGGIDELGLKLTDRVLGVGANSSPSASASQTPADLSGEVADAVQRLLADAADESSLIRFRTESGQTFLAQARLEPGQPMELRLLSDDPGVRAMLAERLNDLRSALSRVGFGDAEVQVDRDPSRQGDHSRHPDERDATPSLDDVAPRSRRPAYGAPEVAHGAAGRLHLIL